MGLTINHIVSVKYPGWPKAPGKQRHLITKVILRAKVISQELRRVKPFCEYAGFGQLRFSDFIISLHK